MSNIPEWETNGLLPPVWPSESPVSLHRSPYQSSLIDFIEHFGTTLERLALLNNFLKYRTALNNLGIIQGFQWIDGSFVENVEFLQNRSPHDIDVVTFYRIPPNETQLSLFQKNEKLFTPDEVKKSFNIDSYMIEMERWSIKNITYWYSLWSHTRHGIWKGFIELSLAPSNDTAALMRLNELQEELQNA